jgi:simple sugar transport system permease protein
VFSISTLIVTLGTSGLFYGLMLQVLGTTAVYASQLPEALKVFGSLNVVGLRTATGTPYGLSVFALVLVGIVLLTWFILRRTLLGRIIYAMGGNLEAVRRSGVNIRRIQFFIYCYMGFLAGIMGIMSGSLIQYSDPTYIVDTELLPVLAGVMLGGASIIGGAGTLTGTLLGMAMIALVEKNLVLLGIPSYWDQFFVGIVLVVGVSITHIQHRIRGRRQLSLLRE